MPKSAVSLVPSSGAASVPRGRTKRVHLRPPSKLSPGRSSSKKRLLEGCESSAGETSDNCQSVLSDDGDVVGVVRSDPVIDTCGDTGETGPGVDGRSDSRREGLSGSDLSGRKCPESIKNLDPNKPPSNIRSLLFTGLFEGIPVKYKFQKHEVELSGFIKDLGYACGCSKCNYTSVLSALDFERHAGATSKHQNNHIFLQNGKTLHVIMKELKGIALNALGPVIEEVVGCQPNFEKYEIWKESFKKVDHPLNPAYQIATGNHQLLLAFENSSTISSSDPTTEDNIGPDLVFYNYGPSIKENASTSVALNVPVRDNFSSCVMHKSPLTELSDSTIQENFLSMENFSGYMSQSSNEMLNPPTPLVQELYENVRYSVTQNKSAESFLAARDMGKHSQDFPCKQEVFAHPPKTQKNAKNVSKKRDNALHRLIFKENGVPDGSELAYFSGGKKILDGYKMGNGIVCSCCNSEISPSQFEAHAGFAAKRQPYRHIYTSNGLTLHELSVSLSKGQNLTAICNDTECAVCGDVGELLQCTTCPKVFHAACLELQKVPAGEWQCPYCKDSLASCEHPTNGAGPITLRARRVVIEVSAADIGGCAICRSGHYSKGVFNSDTVLLCDQCEKEYHVGCMKRIGLCDLKELPRGNWFCCQECNVVHAAVQEIISTGAMAVPTQFSLIKDRDLGYECYSGAADEIQWRLLSGKIQTEENKYLLSKAAAVFRGGFVPIVGQSGCDLVPAMVYGRSAGGQDFTGMLCAILTLRSAVVCATVLRILGREAAELPLVTTAIQSRGKGYFRCLLSCIESLLFHLKVKNLILPAADDVELMWRTKFGFTKMPEEQLKNYEMLPVMMFKGTTMLMKPITGVSG